MIFVPKFSWGEFHKGQLLVGQLSRGAMSVYPKIYIKYERERGHASEP